MFALKESPMKMLYGNTNNAATIPDNIPIPQNLNNALNALSCPEPILPHKRTFISALNSGPFYENGHLIHSTEAPIKPPMFGMSESSKGCLELT